MATQIEVQLQQPRAAGDSHHSFPKGHPRYGGRPKGRQNRFGGDLREAVVLGIQAVGFMEKDKKGWKHGQGGVQGFIEWLALHEPKTAAALFARVLPYFINVGGEVAPPHAAAVHLAKLAREPDAAAEWGSPHDLFKIVR